MPKVQLAADKAALGASALCLVHCLGLPVLIALSPAIASLLDAAEGVHLLVFLFAVPVSAMAMVAGHRRHGLVVPAVLAAIGLGLIGVGALGGLRLLWETGVTVAGSLLLALAHLRNLRASRGRTQPAG